MKTPNNPVRPWTFRMDGKPVPGLPSLQEIVDVLNGRNNNPRVSELRPGVAEVLRGLVQRWKDANWNVEKLCALEPGLEEALHKHWKVLYLPSARGGASLVPLFVGPEATSEMFKHLRKDESFRNRITDAALTALDSAASKDTVGTQNQFDPFKPRAFKPMSDQQDLILDAHQDITQAVQYFGALTVLEWEKLGGPCARCQKYYIKRRASQKVYCSRNCGNATTATLRTAEQRDRERKENLRRAEKAIQQWKRSAKRTKWKDFVSKRTGLTSKWLTRAIGRNDLKAPNQEGS
jgi:hypothetical protein